MLHLRECRNFVYSKTSLIRHHILLNFFLMALAVATWTCLNAALKTGAACGPPRRAAAIATRKKLDKRLCRIREVLLYYLLTVALDN